MRQGRDRKKENVPGMGPGRLDEQHHRVKKLAGGHRERVLSNCGNRLRTEDQGMGGRGIEGGV